MSSFFANQVFHVGNPVLEVSLNIPCMYWCYYCTDFQYWKYCLSVLLQCVNPLHPSISMHILHTVLFTFPKALSRRICLTIKSFYSCWSYPLFSRLSCTIQGWYCMEKLDASFSQGQRIYDSLHLLFDLLAHIQLVFWPNEGLGVKSGSKYDLRTFTVETRDWNSDMKIEKDWLLWQLLQLLYNLTPVTLCTLSVTFIYSLL